MEEGGFGWCYSGWRKTSNLSKGVIFEFCSVTFIIEVLRIITFIFRLISVSSFLFIYFMLSSHHSRFVPLSLILFLTRILFSSRHKWPP